MMEKLLEELVIGTNPENKEYIEFVIRWVRKPLPGRLTTQIFNVKEGDEILWLKTYR